MRSVAIILSGGKGLRLGSEIPKQYIEICGKSILGYTIDAFEKSSVDEIILVAAEEYIRTCQEIASQCGSRKVTDVIRGGAERYDSVLNGLRYLAGRKDAACISAGTGGPVVGTGQEQPEIVLIHDGARPFIRPSVINEIIRSVETEKAAIAAVPCTDTIKIADEYGCIVSTTDRKRTWAAQTPQGFRTGDIFRAYEEVIGRGTADGSLTGITDDAMVYQMVFPDRPVRLINAGHDNFKITTSEDLIRAELMITARKQTQDH